MRGGNHILLILDLLLGVVSVISANIALSGLILLLISWMNRSVILDPVHLLFIMACLCISVITGMRIKNQVIRFFVIIFIFLPAIIMLLSYFQGIHFPLPESYHPR